MATRGYSYNITVTPVSAPDGTAIAREPLQFSHTNHDEIIGIAQRIEARSGLSADDARATAIGLKLLSEVMLKQKNNPLFDPLRGGIRDFIGNLKSLPDPETKAD